MSKLSEQIQSIQKGDESLLQNFLNQFLPLLKKYAYKLAYPEALDDLQYHFIHLLLTISCDGFIDKDDIYILSYIRKTIHNRYIFLSKQQDKLRKTVSIEDLSESESIRMEHQNSTQDNYSNLFWDEIKTILNSHEYEIISLHYKLDFTIAEISLKLHCSRQSINQTKNRALQKLKSFYAKI